MVMDSCVFARRPRRVVRGLGRAFLYLPIYLSCRSLDACVFSTRNLTIYVLVCDSKSMFITRPPGDGAAPLAGRALRSHRANAQHPHRLPASVRRAGRRRIRQTCLGWSMGGCDTVWADVLQRILCRNGRSLVGGCTVLELGAGCGQLGLLAGRRASTSPTATRRRSR